MSALLTIILLFHLSLNYVLERVIANQESAKEPLVLIGYYDHPKKFDKDNNWTPPDKIEWESDVSALSSIEVTKNRRILQLCPFPTSRTELAGRFTYDEDNRYCLFETDPGQTSCADQVTPMLLPLKDKASRSVPLCENNLSKYIFAFGVQLCFPFTDPRLKSKKFQRGISGLIKNVNEGEFLQRNRIQKKYFLLYEICYNTKENTTEWTKHWVNHQTKLPRQYNVETEISIEGFNIEGNRFAEMSTAFRQHNESMIKFTKSERISKSVISLPQISSFLERFATSYAPKDSSPYPMLPKMLVPAEENPYRLWKMTTSHYVNIAALWEPLSPIIDLINERLYLLARRMKQLDEKRLPVWTRAFYHQLTPDSQPTYLGDDEKFVIPNIWSISTYDRHTKRGIVVVVHNTPNQLPKPGQLCQEVAACDFQKWIRESISEQLKDIPIEQTRYAYCCKSTEFSIPQGFENLIDINFEDSVYE